MGTASLQDEAFCICADFPTGLTGGSIMLEVRMPGLPPIFLSRFHRDDVGALFKKRVAT